MPRPATEIARKFAGHLRYLEFTRKKMEAMLANETIVRRDIDQVYSGLFLDATASFEGFLEELFLALLTGRVMSQSVSVAPLVSFNNARAVRPILYRGGDFFDWLPYQRTTDAAKLFFRDGMPFTSLNGGERSRLRMLSDIRNVIAHRSGYSKGVFERRVLGSQNLTPREKTPVGYLRSIYRNSPRQNRYENMMYGLAAIANKLCS